MPVISKFRFSDRLSTVYSDPQANFLVVCLALHLMLEFPSSGDRSMQTSSYVVVNNFISLLKSTGCLSLSVLQARLLVTFYEMGHGINVGASMSIAGAARSARLLGLNKEAFQGAKENFPSRVVAKKEKRVRWAVVNSIDM
ncbi:hypothetical protein VTL71DRAFT_1348 [Oculimacula yallundae]|uniref:Uncharacterized protein n=1 Tax=Oculimacula yallundae TaxID=86028 RepID=A0ABR4CAE6_9HELO